MAKDEGKRKRIKSAVKWREWALIREEVSESIRHRFGRSGDMIAEGGAAIAPIRSEIRDIWRETIMRRNQRGYPLNT